MNEFRPLHEQDRLSELHNVHPLENTSKALRTNTALNMERLQGVKAPRMSPTGSIGVFLIHCFEQFMSYLSKKLSGLSSSKQIAPAIMHNQNASIEKQPKDLKEFVQNWQHEDPNLPDHGDVVMKKADQLEKLAKGNETLKKFAHDLRDLAERINDLPKPLEHSRTDVKDIEISEEARDLRTIGKTELEDEYTDILEGIENERLKTSQAQAMEHIQEMLLPRK
jgi:hypothetical protein